MVQLYLSERQAFSIKVISYLKSIILSPLRLFKMAFTVCTNPNTRRNDFRFKCVRVPMTWIQLDVLAVCMNFSIGSFWRSKMIIYKIFFVYISLNAIKQQYWYIFFFYKQGYIFIMIITNKLLYFIILNYT